MGRTNSVSNTSWRTSVPALGGDTSDPCGMQCDTDSRCVRVGYNPAIVCPAHARCPRTCGNILTPVCQRYVETSRRLSMMLKVESLHHPNADLTSRMAMSLNLVLSAPYPTTGSLTLSVSRHSCSISTSWAHGPTLAYH